MKKHRQQVKRGKISSTSNLFLEWSITSDLKGLTSNFKMALYFLKLKIQRGLRKLKTQQPLNVHITIWEDSNICNGKPVKSKTKALSEAMVEALLEALSEALSKALSEALSGTLSEAMVEALSEAMVEALSEAMVEALSEAMVEALSEPMVEAMVKAKLPMRRSMRLMRRPMRRPTSHQFRPLMMISSTTLTVPM